MGSNSEGCAPASTCIPGRRSIIYGSLDALSKPCITACNSARAPALAKLEFTRSMFFTLEGSKKHCKQMRKGLSFLVAEFLYTFARMTISSSLIPFMAWSDTSISETSTRSVICLHCDAIELGHHSNLVGGRVPLSLGLDRRRLPLVELLHQVFLLNHQGLERLPRDRVLFLRHPSDKG